MIEAPHYSPAGARRAEPFALPADVFDGTVNEPVLHTAVRAYLNNQRQGTHQTKTRSFVSGGNQKPWKQKGTGRARSGSNTSPVWVGGGRAHGPEPRDYLVEMPKKQRRVALTSALSLKARESRVAVLEDPKFDAPKTKQVAGLMDKIGLGTTKLLFVTDSHDENVWKSLRNVPGATCRAASDVNAYDVLSHRTVVLTQAAFDRLRERLASGPAAGKAKE